MNNNSSFPSPKFNKKKKHISETNQINLDDFSWNMLKDVVKKEDLFISNRGLARIKNQTFKTGG